jgi:hypothetical protein
MALRTGELFQARPRRQWPHRVAPQLRDFEFKLAEDKSTSIDEGKDR